MKTIVCKIGMFLSLLSLDMVSATAETSPTLNEPFQSSFERLSHHPCVTLYHRNGRIGCGTIDRDTQTGILKYYDGSSSPGDDPYVIVLDEFQMTTDVIGTIVSNNDNGKLQGILVLNSTNSDNDDENQYLSPEAQAPQGYGTPSSTLTGDSAYPWNGNGDGLVYQDLYGVPVVYVHSADVSSTLRSISQDSDQATNSIVAEFNYYMGPSDSDSASCLGWKDVSNNEWAPKCLPVGGTSVWAVAGSPQVAAQNGNQRPVVMLGTSIDATSMFHDASPGANSAASNILALLMAAKLLGENINDETLDSLTSRIAFGFFQAEAYGFAGSRAFFSDVAYPGFQCDDGLTVPAVAKDGNEGNLACLYPLRPSLAFQNLGEISGMIAVDQVGLLATENTLYAHNDGNDGTFGAFVSEVLQASSTDNFSVSASSAAADEGGDFPYPPTPLTSLLQLSEGAVGGAVLAGYDDSYATNSLYHSHLDSERTRTMNLEAVAASATLLARAAVAAAYDDGSFDSDTSAQYAANLVPELSSDDEMLVKVADCLYSNGLCTLIQKYGKVESVNDFEATGINLGLGTILAAPPNYYASVYDINNGQPFVQVDSNWYGSYTKDDYGKKDSDTFAMRPTSLEMSIRGMLNDFLGRGSLSKSNDENNRVLQDDSTLVSCKSTSDCSGVSYCGQEGDSAVCTGGGVCVCARSQYHIALDEALEAAPNNNTGRFIFREDDEGITPVYTEPYWSNSVGVGVYRVGSDSAGWAALASGLAIFCSSIVATLLFKRNMKKEKLY